MDPEHAPQRFFQFGPAPVFEGTRFSLWAPSARRVSVLVDDQDIELSRKDRGFFEVDVATVGEGALYKFRIDDRLEVPDPASRWQPHGVRGPSAVVNPSSFSWTDTAWRGRAWEEAILYEVHIGTATPEGTYRAFSTHLEALRDLGITAIELMPVGSFAGTRNWGYDGVLPYAPQYTYGTPDDLKALVDRCHRLKMMVFLDAVYNHFGPAGNFLHCYAGPFFSRHRRTPWGDSFNWDEADSDIVRAFFIQNALYWIDAFHFDGLRFDAIHAIQDDSSPHFIEALANALHAPSRGRDIHLILENEKNESRWLARDGNLGPVLHTAQWADDIHNAWHVLLTDEREGYYENYAEDPIHHLGRALAEGFSYQGDPSPGHGGRPRGEPSDHLPPTAFVAFLQNHDQIGNRAQGERLTSLTDAGRLDLAQAVLLLAPQIPMLFQGEDWGAATPFLFFVDYSEEPELASAIRDGRAHEFSRFAAFSSGTTSIPDPNAIDTVRKSVLAWSETEYPATAQFRRRVQELIASRGRHILPLLKTRYRGSSHTRRSSRAIDVIWRFDGGTEHLIANFGSDDLVLSGLEREDQVWGSPELCWNADRLRFPPWSGSIFVTKGAP